MWGRRRSLLPASDEFIWRIQDDQFRNLLERNDFSETFQKVVKLANHEQPLTWHPSWQHCQNHTSLLAADVHQVRVCLEFLRALYSLTRCNFIVPKTNNFNTFVDQVLTGLVRSGVYISRSKLFVARCANTFHTGQNIFTYLRNLFASPIGTYTYIYMRCR